MMSLAKRYTCKIWEFQIFTFGLKEIAAISQRSVYKFSDVTWLTLFLCNAITMLLTSCTRSRVYYVRNYRGREHEARASCFIRRENEAGTDGGQRTWTDRVGPATSRFNCS